MKKLWTVILGNLRKGIFEQHTSPGSETFSRSTSLDATKVIFTETETICPRMQKVYFGFTYVA